MNLVETTSTTLCSIKHFSIDGFWHLQVVTNAMDMNLGKLGDGERQGGLACCSPRDRKELGHDWETKQPLATTTRGLRTNAQWIPKDNCNGSPLPIQLYC